MLVNEENKVKKDLTILDVNILNDLGLRNGARAIFSIIYSFNQTGKYCYLSFKQFAEKTNLSRYQTIKIIKNLAEKNLLLIEKIKRDKHNEPRNNYTINFAKINEAKKTKKQGQKVKKVDYQVVKKVDHPNFYTKYKNNNNINIIRKKEKEIKEKNITQSKQKTIQEQTPPKTHQDLIFNRIDKKILVFKNASSYKKYIELEKERKIMNLTKLKNDIEDLKQKLSFYEALKEQTKNIKCYETIQVKNKEMTKTEINIATIQLTKKINELTRLYNEKSKEEKFTLKHSKETNFTELEQTKENIVIDGYERMTQKQKEVFTELAKERAKKYEAKTYFLMTYAEKLQQEQEQEQRKNRDNMTLCFTI